jgi:glycosyltransferase involved in cell wall biosynthesis
MKDAGQKELVSITIPAYNNPDYTRKTLKSIVSQHYRPLEIILSDDQSPDSLEPLVAEFKEYQGDLFRITYFRQPSNLGMCDNFTFAVNQATGKYLIPMSHDNWFTDKSFITNAVEILETKPECHMCVANSVYENSKIKMLNLLTVSDTKNGWRILEGDEFIRMWRRGGIGWTQAFVIDNQIAHLHSAFEEPFRVSGSTARQLDIADDNLWAFVFVLSSAGSVALTEKVVCKVGTPKNSYSRSNVKWKKTRSKLKFIILYNIYKANLKGKHAHAVQAMAKKQAFEYLDRIFSVKIMQYYNYSFDIILLMGLSIIKKFLKKRKKKRMRTKSSHWN